MSQKSNPLTRGKKQKALALLQHNQPLEAKPLLEHVCRADPRDIQAWFSLGVVCQNLGVLTEAGNAYRQVVTLQPDLLEAWCNLGSVLELQKRFAEALDCYRRALHLNPGMPELRYNVGNVMQILENYDEAKQSYREAIRLRPDYTEAHDQLGVVLAKLGQHTEAIDHFRKTLTKHPDYAPGHYNLAMSLKQIERLDEAVTSYRKTLAINPRDADAHVNLGVVLVKLRKFDEAVTHYHEALRLRPDDADTYNNLGMTCVGHNKLDEAIDHFDKALRLDPENADFHFNRSLPFLLRGDFHNGWNEYRWRWLRQNKAPSPFPVFSTGENDPTGCSVYLCAEQGLGDELFFLRFVPWLKKRGAYTITYRPTSRIASLLSRAGQIDRIAAPSDLPDTSDLVLPVGDLPRLLGMKYVDQIPPSLSLPPLRGKLDEVRSRLAALGPPPYLGITWRAGVKGNIRGLYKEAPLERLAQTLRHIPGTTLALQRLPGENELERLRDWSGKPVHDLTAFNDDLEAMLALLSLLDDYVGVSNTNMHLRAAVGKTARVLVPAPPEWRWMAEGDESPWFPGFTVYRQGYDGDWEQALGALRSDLQHVFGR